MAERKYVLSYMKDPFWDWDAFGMTACQPPNYGDNDKWFLSFRGGLNGFHARMAGAEHHYAIMHAWLPQIRSPKETEYHLATFFFQVDSAVECLVFALNALGCAVKKSGFRDIGDASSLRRITPHDLLGNVQKELKPLSGYNEFYPKTVALWMSQRTLFDVIFEQHDVSKHRHVIYRGGSVRMDAPEGFWNSLGVTLTDEERWMFYPTKDVILGKDLRCPIDKQRQQTVDEFIYLEDIAEKFFNLISETGRTIMQDSISTIPIRLAEGMDLSLKKYVEEKITRKSE